MKSNLNIKESKKIKNMKTERRNQSIKLDIHNELYLNIEKEEIHDVLSNLLSNAIKYTILHQWEKLK